MPPAVGEAMQTLVTGKAHVPLTKLSIVLVVVLAVVLAALFVVPAASASPLARSTPATGSTQQWAFGGSASSTYSCSNQNCFGGNLSLNGSTISLSWNYYIEWVVIYTVTNVSSSQTMIEVQTALNATASFSLTECIKNGTGACTSGSASLNLAGRETGAGFTNVTTGTVNLYASTSSPLGSTPAEAIMNAASNESFNFSGSESISGFSGTGTGGSGSASFDFGGQEGASINFATPLGVVPLNPQPGDSWNASAPFSASGHWSSGYSITASGTTAQGNWTSGAITPSGTETVNGTDLGTFTLYDNYTNPATIVTAQEIQLDFGNGAFVGADGWLLVPATLYGGIYGGLLAGGLVAGHGTPIALVGVQPGATALPTNGEEAYYQHGVGFVGAAVAGTATIPIGGTTGPAISLKAGPEPVSVAQGQYSSITSSSGSSSSGFPWVDLILAVVVVVVVVLAVLMVVRRRRRPSAAGPAALGAAPVAAYPAGPGSQGPAGPSAPAPSPPASSQVATAPVCPGCGQPGTYIAQYGRYYCYADKQYL